MRRLFACLDFISLTQKRLLMARNIFRIFTENKPVGGLQKKYNIPEVNWLSKTAIANRKLAEITIGENIGDTSKR